MQKKRVRLYTVLFCFQALLLFFQPMMSREMSLSDIRMSSPSRKTYAVSYKAISVQPKSEKSAFNLPASLTEIGEEAFYGSAAKTVIFQGNARKIESKAFSHMPGLEKAYLSESIIYIAQDAFDRNSGLTLFGREGSYAAEWARSNGISFEAVVPEMLTVGNRIAASVLKAAVLFAAAALILFNNKATNTGRKPDEGRSFRPQERIELHSIHYAFP